MPTNNMIYHLFEKGCTVSDYMHQFVYMYPNFLDSVVPVTF